LIREGVIKCDNYFIPGVKCRAYGIQNSYLTAGFRQLPVKGKIAIHFKKQRAANVDSEIQKLLAKRAFLTKTLKSPLLKINLKEATAAINRNLQNKLGIAKRRFKKNKNEESYLEAQRVIYTYRQICKSLVGIINNKTFEVVIDKSGRRLHTPITRLPKYLRNKITFEGNPLVAIDIKNCRPYLSLRVLERRFYRKTRGKESHTELHKLDNELFGYMRGHLKRLFPLLCEFSAETLDNIEDVTLKYYLKDVLEGELYDKFVGVEKDHPGYNIERDRVKKQYLSCMYDLPRKGGKFADGYSMA
jgi:hypothetical protein